MPFFLGELAACQLSCLVFPAFCTSVGQLLSFGPVINLGIDHLFNQFNQLIPTCLVLNFQILIINLDDLVFCLDRLSMFKMLNMFMILKK